MWVVKLMKLVSIIKINKIVEKLELIKVLWYICYGILRNVVKIGEKWRV